MILLLRWTEQAVGQLSAIADYISQSSPRYAEGMIARIAARLLVAAEHPELGRRVPEFNDLRIRELLESPYRLIYRPRAECIEVIAIVHERQLLEQARAR